MGKERKHNEETRMEKQLDASAYCGSVGRCICGKMCIRDRLCCSGDGVPAQCFRRWAHKNVLRLHTRGATDPETAQANRKNVSFPILRRKFHTILPLFGPVDGDSD